MIRVPELWGANTRPPRDHSPSLSPSRVDVRCGNYSEHLAQRGLGAAAEARSGTRESGATPPALCSEIKTVPYVPLSHPFVERLIGTMRREYFDKVFFWNAIDLERKLGGFKSYFNQERAHTALQGDTPSGRCDHVTANLVSLENYRWQKHCNGLFQLPIAA